MKDLTNIPERFHLLFLTDWFNGNESEMKSIQRGEMNQLFLEYCHWDVKQRLLSKEINQPEDQVQGFVKD